MTNSKLIDREVTSLYSPTLQARDQANNTGNAVLEITLTDVNDQTPQFNRESYIDYVKEGSNLRIQVQVNICLYTSGFQTSPQRPPRTF